MHVNGEMSVAPVSDFDFPIKETTFFYARTRNPFDYQDDSSTSIAPLSAKSDRQSLQSGQCPNADCVG